ncbi:hypothetical protein Gekk315_00088 [Aeromonas phage Gekk3-15]
MLKLSKESFELSIAQVEETFDRMFAKVTKHGLDVGINTTFEHRTNVAAELTQCATRLEAAKLERCHQIEKVGATEHVHVHGKGYQPELGKPIRTEPPRKP